MKQRTSSPPRILILGGGYVGLYTALQLRKSLRRRAAIAVVDPSAYMTYLSFLPAVASGSVEPRHVVAGLRSTLPGVKVIPGQVTGVDHGQRTARIEPLAGPERELTYDHLVVALGSVTRTLPIPGLAEEGIGFKTIEESIHLRNRVIGSMEAASEVRDAATRRRMLTFTFVGGGFAGIEALAEIEDMARFAVKDFPSIRAEELRFVLIEAAETILPEVGEELGQYAREHLSDRGIEIKLGTTVESATDGLIETSDGDRFETDTLVWTAGVAPNPALNRMDLPQADSGGLRTNAALQVIDGDDAPVSGAWAAGDVALVPDLENPGQPCGPTAQHAVRQARQLGKNIAAWIEGEDLANYRHKNLGMVASLGLYKGVAAVLGLKLRGPVAWFIYRAYHIWSMPTLNRKAHVLLDWSVSVLFPRQTVALGELAAPRKAFETAAAQQDNNGS